MTGRLSVLLAEDDDPLRALLQELLAQRGFVVHATARGDEAVEVARSVEIHVSVLDFHLPGLTGVQVLRQIAADRRVTPSILISGEARQEQIDEAAPFGLVEFLRKPLDLARLRQSLDVLERAHATLRKGSRASGDGRWPLPRDPRGRRALDRSPRRPGHDTDRTDPRRSNGGDQHPTG
ncbi:MAG: response regulator [Planctomycetota bacterium]